MTGQWLVGVIVIGRNEGHRLARCLESVKGLPNAVYVDSGSVDGSVALARQAGLRVIELAEPPSFTAARARNAGIAELLAGIPELEFVQMLDGDCELRPEWLPHALQQLGADSRLALVFGRLRERHPDWSIYNALCDEEWKLPVGEASVCGGISLLRVEALRQVDFYNPTMIAGEDTELCMRLRKAGWKLWSMDVEMACHDAAIRSFRQWWTRTRRSGHGYGEMAALHPDARDPDWPSTVRSILFWGGLLPGIAVGCSLAAVVLNPALWIPAISAVLIIALNIVRLVLRQHRRGLLPRVAWASGMLLVVGKIPQCLGLIGYHYDRVRGRSSRLVEHKGAETESVEQATTR